MVTVDLKQQIVEALHEEAKRMSRKELANHHKVWTGQPAVKKACDELIQEGKVREVDGYYSLTRIGRDSVTSRN